MNEISFAALETGAPAEPPDMSSNPRQLWQVLRVEARQAAASEAALRGVLELAVLRHDAFGMALADLLARKLAQPLLPAERLGEIAQAALAEDPSIAVAAAADLLAIRARDPAAQSFLTPFLYYKGFHALQCHRIAHLLWQQDRRDLAHLLQSRVSEIFAVDIHPAVPVGIWRVYRSRHRACRRRDRGHRQ